MIARGTVNVPGDKSLSHRALILASLATGRSQLRGLSTARDIESTALVLRTLGSPVPELRAEITVAGLGLRGLREPGIALQCGNSGTTARLLAGVVAGHPFSARFEGDQSLSRRPMSRIAEPLRAMGARVEFERGDGLPMTVEGGDLSGIVWNTRAASAQTKGAILLAGLVGGIHVSVKEARRSRDHTERMLASLGVPVTIESTSVSLSPARTLAPLDLRIPGDPSSAAYFAALGVLASEGEVRIPDVCLNPTRIGFFEALRRMGASLRYVDRFRTAGDEAGTIVAAPRRMRNGRIGAAEVPSAIDELPLLGCVAAAAGIELEVTGADELRVKESDRITALVRNLKAVGADAEELLDGFRVRGRKAPLRGRVETYGDHRIAMAFGILAELPGNSIELDDRDCVSVSYPGFWDQLAGLRQ